MKNADSYTRNLIAVIGIAAFACIIIEAVIRKVGAWLPESLFFIAFIFLCLWQWNNMKLTHTSFSLLIIALFLHCAGVFGFYSESPLPFAWDHVTHFFGIFAVNIFLFHFFEDRLQKGKTFNNLFVLFIVLLASLGVGSLIENIEFSGYTFLGEGEGVLYFGVGDGTLSSNMEAIDTDMMNFAGGGWFNAMWDLVFNLLGAITGVIVMLLYKKIV